MNYWYIECIVPYNTDEDAILLIAPEELLGLWWIQHRHMCRQDVAVVHVHCALGILDCLFFCHHLKCLLWWINPSRPCEWTSLRTGQDYKLSDKEEQGELISKSGHFCLALCRAAELRSPFCITMMLCVLGRVRDTCLRVRKPLSLHQAAALNEHDWLWYKGLRSSDNTAGLVRLFVILLSQLLRLIQYQHACVQVLLHRKL